MLEVRFENSNIAQIDDKYSNYHLRRSGILYDADFQSGYFDGGSSWAGAYSQGRRAQIDLTGFVSPVVVLYPRGDYQTICAFQEGLYFENPTGFVWCWHNLSQAAGIEYYVFDEWTPPVPPAGQNYALELFNGAAQRRYHSDWLRMRIIGYMQFNTPWSGSLTYNVDRNVSAFAAVSSRYGIMMPSGRMGSNAVPEGSQPGAPWPTGGMYLLIEGFYFKSPSVLTTGMISQGYSDGWWDFGTGWWNTGGLTVLAVDLQGYPLNYNG